MRLLLAMALFLAGPAWACPVCGEAPEAARGAFMDMTILLTFLPLLMISGGGYFLYRRYQEVEGQRS